MAGDTSGGHTDVDPDRPTVPAETTSGDGVSAVRLIGYGIVTGSVALGVGGVVSSQVLPGDGPAASGLLVGIALGVSVVAGLLSEPVLSRLHRLRHDRRPRG